MSALPAAMPDTRVEGAPPWSLPGVQDLAFDPEAGRLLVLCATRPRSLRLADGVEDLRFASVESATRPIVVRQAVRRAFCLAGPEIVSWSLDDGSVVSRASLGEADSVLLGVSRDGRIAAVARGSVPPILLRSSQDTRVVLAEVATGAVLRTLVESGYAPATRGGADFLPDGRVLLADSTGRLRLFGAGGESLVDLPPPPTEDGQPVFDPGFGVGLGLGIAHAWALDGGRRALVTATLSVEVRDLETGACEWSSFTTRGVAFEEGRRMLFHRGEVTHEMPVQFLDLKTLETEPVVGWGRVEPGTSALDGERIAHADPYGNIRVVRRGDPTTRAQPLDFLTSGPSAIAVAPDATTLLVGGRDGSLRMIRDGRIARALPGHGGIPVLAVGFLADGRCWSASDDLLRVCDASGRMLRETALIRADLTATALGGTRLVFVRDSLITVRRVEDGSIEREAVMPSAVRWGVHLLDDGRTFFGATERALLRVDLATGAVLSTIPVADVHPSVAELVPGAQEVFIAQGDEPARTWRPEDASERPIPGIRNAAIVRCVSATHALVVRVGVGVAETDSICRLHELRGDGRAVAEMPGHDAPITCIAVTGRFAWTAGEDRRLLRWDLAGMGA